MPQACAGGNLHIFDVLLRHQILAIAGPLLKVLRLRWKQQLSYVSLIILFWSATCNTRAYNTLRQSP